MRRSDVQSFGVLNTGGGSETGRCCVSGVLIEEGVRDARKLCHLR